jgi:ribonucleotide monophosphatase NagD (HAD superfamily)
VPVILVTNAPRPRSSVARQLDRLGVPDDCWDAIATSGDAARMAMFEGVVGTKVWHVGEAHDAPFFEPPAILEDPAKIEKVALEEAEGIVCTGPFDPHADPSVMRPQFLLAKTKGLPLLCANPDIVVDRGDSREWCAGALAELYTEMGGESLYFGKPHPPIYDLARRRWTRSGAPSRMIASSPWATASSPMFRAAWARTSTRSSSPGASRGRKPARTPGGQPGHPQARGFLDSAVLEPSFAIAI